MRSYPGGCHCGRVRFEAFAADDAGLLDCDCSICSKQGYLHLIVPETQFKLLQGREVLTTYTFGTHMAQHLFCAHCGVKSFYVPRSHPDCISVNARCLDENIIGSMNIEHFDGRNWESGYADLTKP